MIAAVMDWGLLIPGAMIATGLAGFCRIAWQGRTVPQPRITATRSHVRRVAPTSCVDSGSTARSATGLSRRLGESTHTPSLALDAYSTIAGGTELEARIETARRRLAQHGTFGDAALRHRDRDIAREFEAYLAHPSHDRGAR